MVEYAVCNSCVNKNICRYATGFEAFKKYMLEDAQKHINELGLDKSCFSLIPYCKHFSPVYSSDYERGISMK